MGYLAVMGMLTFERLLIAIAALEAASRAIDLFENEDNPDRIRDLNRFSRHPAYVGTTLIVFGAIVGSLAPISLLALFLALPLGVRRIRFEVALLSEHGVEAHLNGTEEKLEYSAASELALVLRGVSKSFGRSVVIDGLDLEVNSGETLAVIGKTARGRRLSSVRSSDCSNQPVDRSLCAVATISRHRTRFEATSRTNLKLRSRSRV